MIITLLLSISVKSDIDETKVSMVLGTPTSIKEFPWQISLEMKGYLCWLPEFLYSCLFHSCGGLIIDSRFIITSTHCFNNSIDANDYVIRTGSNRTQEDGTTFEIEIHPKYNNHNHTLEYDNIRNYVCVIFYL